MILERLLPADVTAELSKLLNKKYAAARGQRQFSVTTRRDFDQVSTVVVLSDARESFYYPVEARINFVEEEMKPEEAAFFLVDYIDLYFEEFFHETENLFIPIDWTSFTYEAVDFEMKGQILNRYAERLADQMLADSDLLDQDGSRSSYTN